MDDWKICSVGIGGHGHWLKVAKVAKEMSKMTFCLAKNQ